MGAHKVLPVRLTVPIVLAEQMLIAQASVMSVNNLTRDSSIIRWVYEGVMMRKISVLMGVLLLAACTSQTSSKKQKEEHKGDEIGRAHV